MLKYAQVFVKVWDNVYADFFLLFMQIIFSSTSILLIPVTSISIKDKPTASLVPGNLHLLLKKSLCCSLLGGIIKREGMKYLKIKTTGHA